jgi:hypothetical protein
MVSAASPDQSHTFLATALASRREKQVAIAIAGIALVAFLALAPFVRLPLAQWPAFIPAYEAALFLMDLITAVLLFDQFFYLRSLSVLLLACAYLFDALMIVPHALSFPAAFATTGLLGAKEQTTAWLYVFWHGGFPLFVIAYSVFRDLEESSPRWTIARRGWAIAASCIGVSLLVTALTLLATSGHGWLPIVMQGSDYSLLVTKGISPAVLALTLIGLLALWRSKQRIIDLWLMVVMWAWLFDIALASVIGSTRFDLGFYAGRIFGLVAASFLLVTLLIEMARLHARAIGAVASIEARLAQMSEPRQRPEPSSARGETTDAFIHRQNLARYHSLLQSGSLDETQRRSIEKLIEDEEARQPGD